MSKTRLIYIGSKADSVILDAMVKDLVNRGIAKNRSDLFKTLIREKHAEISGYSN